VTMLVALAAATTVALTPMLATLLADQAANAVDDGNPRRAAELSAQSMDLVPSLETLYVQVIALQQQGDKPAARDALRANEQVWLHQLDGLLLAQPLLGDDPEYADRINSRIERLQTLQDSRTQGNPPV
ncbi:MAG: hypothetical protein KDC46_13825, partial [Thermoleophilia bacterium]|nr:hypothetical protein [Thermoleophilia bacterium]